MQLMRAIESIAQATVVYYSEPDFIIFDVTQRLEAFDIAILCQQADTRDEINIGKAISKYNAFCQIVFISKTGLLNPAYYEISHLYTLSTKHVPQYLNMVMRKAIENLEKTDRDQLLVTTNSEKRFVPCRDVLYLEHIIRKTSIVTGYGAFSTKTQGTVWNRARSTAVNPQAQRAESACACAANPALPTGFGETVAAPL